MIYADYTFYKNEFCGKMSEEDYARLSRKASNYLDYVCFDRITEVTEKVKNACCAVAETYLLNEQGGGIASESNDGISVTYVNGGTALSEEQRLYQTVQMYLAHTGLMYRGVDNYVGL